MWRHAKASYLQYSVEMGGLIRQCLKEPYRTKAMQKNAVYFKEATYQGGVAVNRVTHENLKSALQNIPEASK